MLKFEQIRPGEYRAKLGPVYLWVFREWRDRRWWWAIGSHQGYPVWDVEGHQGPFKSRREAIADAIARHAVDVME